MSKIHTKLEMPLEDWVRVYQALEVSLAVTRLQITDGDPEAMIWVGKKMRRIQGTLLKVRHELDAETRKLRTEGSYDPL
jgi:hypothetical protein